MLPLSLLVVCVLFSCLALLSSLYSMKKTLETRSYRLAWKQLEDAYTLTLKEWQAHYVQIDGDVDRLKDQMELLRKSFTRFRSRVTMQERREQEREEVQEPKSDDNDKRWILGPLPANRPLTEEEKDRIRFEQHQRRFGFATVQPRDITED